MKFINSIGCALAASVCQSLVLPENDVMAQVVLEPGRRGDSSVKDTLSGVVEGAGALKDRLSGAVDDAEAFKDRLVSAGHDVFQDWKEEARSAWDSTSDWVELAADDQFDDWSRRYETAGTSVDEFEASVMDWMDDRRMNVQEFVQRHHEEPTQTIYQLISECKYTTKLTAWINDYPDLVEQLNGSAANYTLFAPTDQAFEKIPKHHPKPSKDELKQILFYHISDQFYPAGKVLVTHTIPSTLVADNIGGERQRLSTNIGFRGLTINFYARVVAVDTFATNGVIHAIDNILVLPKKVVDVIQLLPGEFSTLALALQTTGLADKMTDPSTHVGGTIFAPSNYAFQKLGHKVNAFLFSKHGRQCLEALLLYHMVSDQTLYSDAYYEAKTKSVASSSVPKGYFHYELTTAFEDRKLSIDVGRYGRLINIKINGFSDVTIEDGIADDGVIQAVSSVLIPPYKHHDGSLQYWDGEEELEVDALMQRLQPYMSKPAEL